MSEAERFVTKCYQSRDNSFVDQTSFQIKKAQILLMSYINLKFIQEVNPNKASSKKLLYGVWACGGAFKLAAEFSSLRQSFQACEAVLSKNDLTQFKNPKKVDMI